MKKRDELNELRGLGADELQKRAAGTEEELLKLRFRHASGQLEHTAQLSLLRRSVSRIRTVMREKELAEAAS